MPACPSCGHANSATAKFCEECGTALESAQPSREQRKTVTVLFCDVTGSTALGESVDPEALRALLARYFERMKGILESHGASVEKFIGDAVMAVFGVPQVHEDDALRACRAAIEMQEALPELGLQARIGLNTGEVVTGTEERLATGDAVNVAARLEQAAQPGEILLGPETLALVAGAVDTEPVAPLELKGKAEPVDAFRLAAVTGELMRRHDVPMVGRDTELRRLQDAYEQASRDRSCQLFTILGTAGVGKSRLAYEFLADLDATVVRGRCVSYGEGITYWPVVEVVKQLRALPSDPAAAAALRSLLGESDEGTTADEIAWAFRKLLEEQAEARPLVCLFDDIHWGEVTFLDLIEHVADLSRGEPLLLLCMARPELLDKRPGWGGGKLNATTILLEPLSAGETEALVEELGGVDSDLRDKILAAAEGNPLFVEEMLALVRASGDGDIQVPPTIHALLAARLDQLDARERAVLERGSVEGRVFHRGAVQALAPDERQVPERLVALVRKELLRPDKTQLAGDDAFRFRHLLIRDAAYDALPKSTRAELHERFATWLERHGRELVELDEILGHHLEQAARFRADLGQPDPELAERAGDHLAAAGRRALWRGDSSAATHLLERALGLIRPIRLDVDLELDLAGSVFWVDPRRAKGLADAVADRAQAEGDARGVKLAQVESGVAKLTYDPDVEEVQRRVDEALDVLPDDDHAGLVRVWVAQGWVSNFVGRSEEFAQAGERALRHSRAAGQRYTQVFGMAQGLLHGPRPADEALEALAGALPPNPYPAAMLVQSQLLAMLGRGEEARRLAEEQAARLSEIEGPRRRRGEEDLAVVAVYEGDYEKAVEAMTMRVAALEESDHSSFLSTQAPKLGRWLCLAGRYDDAERYARLGRDLGDERDHATQTLWRQAQALVHSGRGEHEEAERLAREAVQVADRSDNLNSQGETRADLGLILTAAGRGADAAPVLEEAIDRFERKRNVVMAGRARERLAEIRKENR